MVEICRQAFEQKLFAGTSGNLSVCLREENIMLITPTSVRYETMEADDIVAVNLADMSFEGRFRPSSETPMHATIYQNMPKVNAVFHTHSPYATSFAVVKKPIPYILIEMLPFIGGDVPCAEFAAPGSKELGLSEVEPLKHRNGCLLANHGVLAVGETLPQAFIRAEYVEDAAKIYHYALQVGEPVILPLPDDIK